MTSNKVADAVERAECIRGAAMMSHGIDVHFLELSLHYDGGLFQLTATPRNGPLRWSPVTVSGTQLSQLVAQLFDYAGVTG